MEPGSAAPVFDLNLLKILSWGCIRTRRIFQDPYQRVRPGGGDQKCSKIVELQRLQNHKMGES